MYVFYDAQNPRNQIRCISASDPAIPPGWVLSGGSDGAIDIAPQSFVPGSASGGFPTYPVNGKSVLQNLLELDGTASTGAGT